VKPLRGGYAGALWAMKKWYAGNDDRMARKIEHLLGNIHEEFGWKTRLIASVVGRFLYASAKKEEVRLAQGWTYEPRSYCEKNTTALAIDRIRKAGKARVLEIQWVTSKTVKCKV